MAEMTTGGGRGRAAAPDPVEVAGFSALADEWWDPDGSFRPLHRINPVRIRFVRDVLAARHGRDVRTPMPLAGLSVLDVGCGGGLVAEPLARLGAVVLGIDPSERTVAVAADHAARAGIAVDYRAATVEDLRAEGLAFDAVLALEVIEHVPDVDAFVEACVGLARPGGTLVFASLNRTARAFALAILGAEYVLGWLPPGTHQWHRFVRPSELAAALRRSGARLEKLSGLSYDVLAGEWRLERDLSVNYMAAAAKG